MTPTRNRLMGFLGLVFILSLNWAHPQGLYADMVLFDGTILTADSEDPGQFTIAEAVAIYDGKFVSIGTTEQVLQSAGPNTQRIDLEGKTVLPGLIETHLHVNTQTAGHHLDHPVERTDPPIRWTSKAEGLAQLRTLALSKQPGDWIVVTNRQSRVDGKILSQNSPEKPTMAELDAVTAQNPLVIVLGGNDPLLVNSLALNALLERYPGGVPGMNKGPDGKPDGILETAAAYTMKEFYPELSPTELEELAPLFRKELQEPAARGLTTVASRIDTESLRIYQLLDEREEMPVRLAYGTEMAAYHPLAEMLFRKVPNRAGHGSPWLWLSGATMLNIEGSTGPSISAACIHGSYPKEDRTFSAWGVQPWGPNGSCRLTDPQNTVLRDALLASARFGWAITNIHIAGDRSLDDYMDVMEEAEQKYGIDVAALRFSADHCRSVTEEQAQRAKRLGITFTCAFPSPLEDPDQGVLGAYRILHGVEKAADSLAPFKRLVELGLKPSSHCESHRGWAFSCMQYSVTRKDKKTGRVWGARQRIDRREALYTYTRWAAWHVWKDKYIGSIERGKWADLVIIDQDYLTVPEDEIAQLNPLMTVVGGKIQYSEPSFAQSLGLPTVGFQAPADWWER